MSTLPFISQARSLFQAITGDFAGAKKTQDEFLDAWVHHPGQQISDLADNIPVVGHIKGLVHLAMGDTEAAVRSEEAATRTLAVIGAGALTAGTGGAAAPILAGVVAGIAADAAITGIESARHHKFEPHGYIEAASEIGTDWRGGVFDVVALGVGDGVISSKGSVTKAKCKTTKVFRVEGEGNFLTKKGMVEHGANSRLFPGPGGKVIESPNIIKLIVPPKEENRPVKFRSPAALCLNVGDAARAETYYAQKLLQYQEAAEKIKTTAETVGTSLPAASSKFEFKIKSFRILTSDVESMLRDVPLDDKSTSSTGVRRVDVTKTSKSFECPHPVYAPLIEKAIPGTFKEVKPVWLERLPKRLLEAMRDHQVAYGRVRTCVIVASKFTKASLLPNIGQKITQQELTRLAHGPVPLSSLSDKGVGDIEVRSEPVRRLRQSREVKCGRTVASDTDHGRHMEYLAEFGDGSTSWIPSYNVASDLKEEFWRVVTSKGKEVAEIVKADSTGRVTVKQPDGTTTVVDQTNIFWQEEENHTPLTDVELEALLHHGHFGNDVRDCTPCTAKIKTNWARIEGSPNVAFMKDPAAEKAGEYKDVNFGQRTIEIGIRQSRKFLSRDIPFFIVGNGSLFDIKVMRGVDASKVDDHKGEVTLSLPDRKLVSGTNEKKLFHISPMIFTAGVLIVEAEWGSIVIDSKDTTIGPDPTVDQGIYKDVAFTANSMKLKTGAVGKAITIPFLLKTHDETIDITMTAGPGKLRKGDKFGQVTAVFGQNNRYICRYSETHRTLYKGCRVYVRPPPATL